MVKLDSWAAWVWFVLISPCTFASHKIIYVFSPLPDRVSKNSCLLSTVYLQFVHVVHVMFLSGIVGRSLARRKCLYNRGRGWTDQCSHVTLWEYNKVYASWRYAHFCMLQVCDLKDIEMSWMLLNWVAF